MDEILEIVNNNIEEVLNNPELLQRVCNYLNSNFVIDNSSLKANPNVLRISSFIIPKIKEDPSIVLLFPYELMNDENKQQYLNRVTQQKKQVQDLVLQYVNAI